MKKLKIRKGDKVLVIAGKDRGKKGKVLFGQPKHERVVVEGVNLVKHHVRPTQESPQGGIVQRETGIHISNVKLVCPACGEATRVGVRRMPEGKGVRVCKKCEADIDKA